jgi:NADPH:quinone reductase-like Zn-dependent oxidoreductase
MPRAVTIRQIPGKPGEVYYPLEVTTLAEPKVGEDEVVVKIKAVALNHRDLFIRQHLYPGTTFGVPLLSDCCGVVIEAGSSTSAQRWKGKRVVLNPGKGWQDSIEGPEDPKGYAILGGTKLNPIGTFSEVVSINASELEEAPSHLSDVEAAALPLTGLTAWRATKTKSGTLQKGRNILVTGIGGGVALMALSLATAAGANVYVSSSSEEKLQKAKELGAKGGVNYRNNSWEKDLLSQLPAERPYLDAIIDGAGGDIVAKGVKMLKVSITLLIASSWTNIVIRLAAISPYMA